jgi:alpha-glucosidase
MMREIVDVLKGRNQRYVLILDPGIHMSMDLGSYMGGVDQDVFLKTANNAIYKAIQWPGVVAFPDWLASNTEKWWIDELTRFFDPDKGIDIDGIWWGLIQSLRWKYVLILPRVDMNEASNFCPDTNCDPDCLSMPTYSFPQC